MQSTLFTELTASEEANLSGGNSSKTVIKKNKIDIDQDAKGGKVIIKKSKFDDDATISADGTNGVTFGG